MVWHGKSARVSSSGAPEHTELDRIGDRIRYWRGQKSVKQKELLRRMQRSRSHIRGRSSLSDVERNKREITAHDLEIISKVLHVPLQDFLPSAEVTNEDWHEIALWSEGNFDYRVQKRHKGKT